MREYVACDPRAEFYEPPLRGFRLEGGAYVPVVPEQRGGVWTLHSEVLGLTFRQFSREVRLMDPATGRDLPTYDEMGLSQRDSAARAEAAEARQRTAEERQRTAEAARRNEAEARRAADARVAELEVLLAQDGDSKELLS